MPRKKAYRYPKTVNGKYEKILKTELQIHFRSTDIKKLTAKQIPEDILYALAKEINGDIERVTILPNNEVRFVLSDNTETLKHWVQPSRAESWTDEMKLEASRASKERSRNYADCNKN